MKSIAWLAMLAAACLAAPAVYAQQASAPAGSTGQCKDGTYSSQASKRGACHGHQGVQEWYSTTAAAAPAPAAAMPAPAAASTSVKKSTPMPASTAAAGGGPGQVWVNSSSKVYHCPGDRWYGKTKSGQYMTEAAAKAAGDRASAGKSCSP